MCVLRSRASGGVVLGVSLCCARCVRGNGYELIVSCGCAHSRIHTYSFTNDDLDANAWIGATDMAAEGTFVWVGPGKMQQGVPFYEVTTGAIDGAYNNWADGEPNESGEEDCVEMRNGQARWYVRLLRSSCCVA